MSATLAHLLRRKAPAHKPVVGCRGHDHTPDETTPQTRVVDNVRSFRRLLADHPTSVLLVRSQPKFLNRLP